MRWLPSAIAIALVSIGFFVHGLHEWVRVSMFVAIVGVAAWGSGAETQVKMRDSADATADVVTPVNQELPVQRNLAE